MSGLGYWPSLELGAGHVLVEVAHDRKVPRVVAFLDLICATYRRGPIVVITDNWPSSPW